MEPSTTSGLTVDGPSETGMEGVKTKIPTQISPEPLF